MEGSKFREERERIEELYTEIDSLIKDQSIEVAEEKINSAKSVLTELTADELSDIQKRSVFNLKIKGDSLVVNLEKVKSKKK